MSAAAAADAGPDGAGPAASSAPASRLAAALGAVLSPRRRAELGSLLAWLAMGLAYVVVKRAFDDASPFLFNCVRFCISFVFLLAVYPRRRVHLRAHAAGSLVVGACLSAGTLFQTAALSVISPSRCAFLTALCVPITPLLEPALTRRAPPPGVLLSAAMAAVGTYLLTDGGGGAGWGRGDNLMVRALRAVAPNARVTAAAALPSRARVRGTAARRAVGRAAAAADGLRLTAWLLGAQIACAVLYACHFLMLNRYANAESYESIAVGQVLVTAVTGAPFIALDADIKLLATPYCIAGLLSVGIFATGCVFAILSWAQRHVSASRTAVLCATEPLFAAFFAFVILGEMLSGKAIGDGAIIVVSVVVSSVDFEWSDLSKRWRALRSASADEETAGATKEAAPAEC